jgi:hypothetical protein
MIEQVRHAPDIGANYTQAAGHSFGDTDRIVIDVGGVKKNVCPIQNFWHSGPRYWPGKGNPLAQPKSGGSRLRVAESSIAPVTANHH